MEQIQTNSRQFFYVAVFTLLLIAPVLEVNSQNFVWAKQLGGTLSDKGEAITTDASGNVYTTGTFRGSMDCDPGAATYNLNSAATSTIDNVFISKLDSSGNFVWAKRIGGANSIEVNAIAVDASGFVYITGQFFGTCDFDPGSGTFNLTSPGTNLRDVFICKLTSLGNFVWAKQIGGASHDYCQSITIDSWGNIYTTGSFNGTADFNPGSGTFNMTALDDDAFISMLDSSGSFVWAKQLRGLVQSSSSSSSINSYSIKLDANGNIYTTGAFTGDVDFDPSIATYSLTAIGTSCDVFICKLDALGDFVWAKQIGGSPNLPNYGYDIVVDYSGNIYTTGVFSGTADFDPGMNTFNLTSIGSEDIYINKLDPAGNFIWAKSIGSVNFETSNSLVVDVLGNVYATGRFQGTVDFDPNGGTFNLTSASQYDIFIVKLDATGNYVWAKQIGGNGIDEGQSIAIEPSGTIYTTGYFISTVDFDPGIGTFTLTPKGVYDAFVLKLKDNICSTTTNTITASACTKYTSPSAKYSWTASGIYNDTIPNTKGCDSVIVVNLTINTVDVSVTVNAPMLTANASGAAYQWVDCNNGYASVSEGANQVYNPKSIGNYAVIVTQNNCVDTSACYAITNVSVLEIRSNDSFSVYPNPVQNALYIESREEAELCIYNSQGQLLKISRIYTGENILQVENFKEGLYTLNFNTKSTSVFKKIIKTME